MKRDKERSQREHDLLSRICFLEQEVSQKANEIKEKKTKLRKYKEKARRQQPEQE